MHFHSATRTSVGALLFACALGASATAAAQASHWGSYVGFDESGDNVYVYCKPDAIVSQAMSLTGRAYVMSYLHRVTPDGTRTTRIVSSAAVNRTRLQCFDNAQFSGTGTPVVGAASTDANDSSTAMCPAAKPYGKYADCQVTLSGAYPQNGGDDAAFVYYGSACGNGFSSISTRLVGQQTGDPNNMAYRIYDDKYAKGNWYFFNDTVAGAGVYGTDLGYPFYAQGKLYFLFGDTKNAYGSDADAAGNERHTSLAYAYPYYGLRTFFGGVPFSGWYGANSAPYDAKQVVPKLSANGPSALPSGGFSISEGGHNYKYIWYTQVSGWGGGLQLGGGSGVAYSIDDGAWKRADATASWKTVKDASGVSSPSNFTTANIYQEEIGPNAGYIYLFGTAAESAYDDVPAISKVKLARVRARHASIIDKSQYTYWNGSSWSSDESTAAFLLSDQYVRDISVAYNSYTNRYMMMYLENSASPKFVLLTATSLTGPWKPSNLTLPYALGMYTPVTHGRMMHGAGQHVSYFVSEAPPSPYNLGAWYMDVTRSTLSGCSP